MEVADPDPRLPTSVQKEPYSRSRAGLCSKQPAGHFHPAGSWGGRCLTASPACELCTSIPAAPPSGRRPGFLHC